MVVVVAVSKTMGVETEEEFLCAGQQANSKKRHPLMQVAHQETVIKVVNSLLGRMVLPTEAGVASNWSFLTENGPNLQGFLFKMRGRQEGSFGVTG